MSDDPNQDWRISAEHEYRERRKHLVKLAQSALAEADRAHQHFKQIRGQIEELDAAANVFGIHLANSTFRERLFADDDTPPTEGLFKDVALQYLRDAYPEGVKAAAVLKEAQEKLGREFHRKTAGMTLYRLSQENKVRREGHKWFFVPEGEGSPTEPSSGSPSSGGDND